MHSANVFFFVKHIEPKCPVFEHYGTWHLSLDSISFDAFLFRIFGMVISVSFFGNIRFLVFRCCMSTTFFGLERIASTLVVTPGGLHRTTACCFLTACLVHSPFER